MKRLSHTTSHPGNQADPNSDVKVSQEFLSLKRPHSNRSGYNESSLGAAPIADSKSLAASSQSMAMVSSGHSSAVPMQESMKFASSMPSSGSMVSDMSGVYFLLKILFKKGLNKPGFCFSIPWTVEIYSTKHLPVCLRLMSLL